MSEKFRLDCKIGFQNTFYTKCINVTIDSIGPSIILRSIFCEKYALSQLVMEYENLSSVQCMGIDRKIHPEDRCLVHVSRGLPSNDKR